MLKILLSSAMVTLCVCSVAYAENQMATTIESAVIVENKTPKINLNQADVAALIHSFKGIGKKRAQAIVHYRESHGPFKSIEDLTEVTGFGPLFVSRHRQELEKIFTVN